MNAEIRKQEKLYLAEKKDFRRRELPRKYTVKILYGQNNRRFEDKYLRKLERNWRKQKGKDKMTEKDELTSSSGSRNLEERIISDI